MEGGGEVLLGWKVRGVFVGGWLGFVGGGFFGWLVSWMMDGYGWGGLKLS